jgi:hypothetical protein
LRSTDDGRIELQRCFSIKLVISTIALDSCSGLNSRSHSAKLANALDVRFHFRALRRRHITKLNRLVLADFYLRKRSNQRVSARRCICSRGSNFTRWPTIFVAAALAILHSDFVDPIATSSSIGLVNEEWIVTVVLSMKFEPWSYPISQIVIGIVVAKVIVPVIRPHEEMLG